MNTSYFNIRVLFHLWGGAGEPTPNYFDVNIIVIYKFLLFGFCLLVRNNAMCGICFKITQKRGEGKDEDWSGEENKYTWSSSVFCLLLYLFDILHNNKIFTNKH